ncbi:MAG: MFS transporter [Actinomycetia bacterium]|nr:MFS transporter [Actinomycetes bacterium]MCP5033056.1 MFS transporter [Actinomycetes bacterium]
MSELADRPPADSEIPSGSISARFLRSPLGQTLAIRSFRYYWVSTFFYFLAFGTQRFTFVWLVLELSDNAALAGVTAFALGIPAFFITLPAGAYADRLNRKTMVVWTNLAGAATSIAIAILIWADVMTVMVAIVMALMTGVATAATQPPLTAMIPTIVPRERLMNGIVLRTMGQNLAMVLGAALGGIVIDVWNIGGAFAILTVAYGLSIAAMFGVHSQPMPKMHDVSERPSLRTSVGEGLTFIYRNPGLLGLVVLLAVLGLVMLGPVLVLMPEIAREDLGQEATGASILFAITSVGMLVMSIGLASIGNLRRKGALLLITLMIGGVIVIGLGASQWYVLTAAIMFLWGLGGGIMVNLNQTLAQSHTPDEMMGRVMSVVALAIAGMMPLGSLAAGGGAALIGAREWLMVCGAALIVIGTILWVRLPALRKMD